MTGTKEFEQLLRKKLFVPRILWFALTGAMLLYAGIAYLFASRPDTTAQLVSESFRLGIYVSAAALALVSLASRLFAFSRERLERALARPVSAEQLVVKDQYGRVANPEQAEVIEALPEKQLKILWSLSWCFIPFIITLAINETIVMAGLILVFLTSKIAAILPFLGTGLFLNLLMFNQPNATAEEAQRILR